MSPLALPGANLSKQLPNKGHSGCDGSKAHHIHKIGAQGRYSLAAGGVAFHAPFHHERHFLGGTESWPSFFVYVYNLLRFQSLALFWNHFR